MLALGANGRGRAGLLSALRPQDVFATSLYTGTGASQTINSGFAPDFVWDKSRNNTFDHVLADKLRGAAKFLRTNTTGAETAGAAQNFTASGFVTEAYSSGDSRVAWPIKRAPKFFDIVTYTGDGTSGRVIPHALGIKPGMIIVKRRDAASEWPVWHVANGDNNYMTLNTTDAANGSGTRIQTSNATTFTVGTGPNVSGATYVAYLFAHDPDTTNGIVQCGSFTHNASIGTQVDLGWQPQFLIVKAASVASNWFINDAGRGFTNAAAPTLKANLSDAEGAATPAYQYASGSGFFNRTDAWAGGTNVIYFAIRAPIT